MHRISVLLDLAVNHLKILHPLFLSKTASNDYLVHLEFISNTFGAFPARFAKNSLTLYALMTCFDVIHTSDTITLYKSAKIFRN